jgi:hypothetical protein
MVETLAAYIGSPSPSAFQHVLEAMVFQFRL